MAIYDDEKSVGTHSIKVEVRSENGKSDTVIFTFTLKVTKQHLPDPQEDPDTPDIPETPGIPDKPDGIKNEPDAAPSGSSDTEVSGGFSMDTNLMIAVVVIAVAIIGICLPFIIGKDRK